MKRIFLLLAVWLSATVQAEPFTYQGTLSESGAPADGSYDFLFKLYDGSDPNTATLKGSAVPVDDLPVSDGVFTATIDPGILFDGTPLWLEVSVRPGNSTGGYTQLLPLQAITAAPEAQVSLSVVADAIGSAQIADGSIANADLASGSVTTIKLANQSVTTARLADDSVTTAKLVDGNVTAAKLASDAVDSSKVADGSITDADLAGGIDPAKIAGTAWTQAGNSPAAGAFLGTNNTEPLELRVNGKRVGVITDAVDGSNHAPNVLLGAENNVIDPAVAGATIGGGGGDPASTSCGDGSQPCVNTVLGDYGTVSGGKGNYASGGYASVSGGYSNTASGLYATVGGGRSNTASGDNATVGGGGYNTASGTRATVGGGYSNTAIVWRSTVGGGGYNTASGYAATVPGGANNQAGGHNSLAAGYYATVRNNDSSSAYYSGDSDGDEGTFIWADSTIARFISTGPDQFLVRANGGAWFGQTPSSGDFSPDLSNGYFHIVADGQTDLILGGSSNTDTNDDGILSSDPRYPGSDLIINSNDEITFYLNNDNTSGESSGFAIVDRESSTTVFVVHDTGNATLAGTLTQNSDRDNKERIEAIDPQAVLAKLAALPLYRWSYKGEQARHIGPMAQDFHAAFCLGDTDKGIAMVDPDGVALAAIQAVARENQALQAKVDQQQQQLTRQQQQLALLQADRETQQQQLAQLQQALEALQASQQQLLTRLRQAEIDDQQEPAQ